MNSTANGQNTLDGIGLRLGAAIQRRFGCSASIENLDVATLGGSNRTILFDLVEGRSRRRLVFRQETYRLGDTPFISPHAQFELLKIAYRHDIPVPEPVFEMDEADRLERGHVVACVAGETVPKRLLTDPTFANARKCFAAQAGEILAKLHAIAPDLAPFLEDSVDSMDPLAAQMSRYDSYEENHPALEIGFRWLEMHRPVYRHRKIIHGDFRNGNMILDSNAIQAVLDWECAHLGSGAEDIAWLCLRSWRFGNNDLPVGGFGPRDELYDAYVANGGDPIDDEDVHWWGIFGLVRWAILNMMQAHGHLTGQRRSPSFVACGRSACAIEYDLLMTILGRYS